MSFSTSSPSPLPFFPILLFTVTLSAIIITSQCMSPLFLLHLKVQCSAECGLIIILWFQVGTLHDKDLLVSVYTSSVTC